jgi:hypothetical protein
MDRANISYASVQMNASLGFSAAVYGFGAGVFFLGYSLFEIPSNLMMVRFALALTQIPVIIAMLGVCWHARHADRQFHAPSRNARRCLRGDQHHRAGRQFPGTGAVGLCRKRDW